MSQSADSEECAGRILVVEDDVTTAESLCQLLAIVGFEFLRATDLAAARNILSKPDHGCCLVLLDLVLPDGDGLDFLRWIRATIPGGEPLPVIVVTSKDSMMDRVAALESGASDYVTKPFHLVELRARISAALRETALRRQIAENLENTQQSLREQKRLSTQLEETNQKLLHISEVKDQFIGIASHDLRSPLTNVKGYTELLLHGAMGNIDQQQSDALRIILRNTDHLLGILNNLLDVSRIDSGTMNLNLVTDDICALVRIAVKSIEARAQEKGIALASEIPASQLMIECDTDRILSVVENLLSNAVKFCMRGDQVRVKVDRHEDGVFIEVNDDGPGIPEHEQAKVFSRFCKLSVRPTGGEKSTGLGLALVKSFVEMHGGTVSFISAEGKGTAFRIYLPAVLPQCAQ